jgi:hypothetical protein
MPGRKRNDSAAASDSDDDCLSPKERMAIWRSQDERIEEETEERKRNAKGQIKADLTCRYLRRELTRPEGRRLTSLGNGWHRG